MYRGMLMFRKLIGPIGGGGKVLIFGVCMVMALVMTGCATSAVKSAGPVFFPPAPDLPRVQYLTTISGVDDVQPKKSSFWLWLFGKEEEQRNVSIYKPYGVTVNKGKIYVCDLGGRIAVIDPGKRTFTFLGGKELKGLKKPLNVVFDADDNMYVADIERKLVLVYGPDGLPLLQIGAGMNLKPGDVGVDAEYIYLLDMAGNDIKLFDRKTGALARSIGKLDENNKGLALPTSMTFDARGAIYVTNITGSNVVKLDRDGHVISSFGKLGDGFGDFARPKGIAVGPDGRIYIVDNGMQQVDIFNEEGRLLMPFGAPGLVTGSLNLPVGIAVTRDMIPYFNQYADPSFELDSLIFVTNQFGNAKLSVYGLGLKKGVDYDKVYGTESQPPEKKEPDIKPDSDSKK